MRCQVALLINCIFESVKGDPPPGKYKQWHKKEHRGFGLEGRLFCDYIVMMCHSESSQFETKAQQQRGNKGMEEMCVCVCLSPLHNKSADVFLS